MIVGCFQRLDEVLHPNLGVRDIGDDRGDLCGLVGIDIGFFTHRTDKRFQPFAHFDGDIQFTGQVVDVKVFKSCLRVLITLAIEHLEEAADAMAQPLRGVNLVFFKSLHRARLDKIRQPLLPGHGSQPFKPDLMKVIEHAFADFESHDARPQLARQRLFERTVPLVGDAFAVIQRKFSGNVRL